MKKNAAKKQQQNKRDQEITILQLKLVSGDTIIGKVVASDESKLILRDIVQSKDITYPTESGINAAVYYSAWFHDSDSEVYLLNKSHIVCAAQPSLKLVRSYVENLVKQNLDKRRQQSLLEVDDD